jgi:hypothetical protein
MNNVRFFGGEFGIYTTKPSPGWQFMTIDTYFEGQRKAAIQTREAGLTMVRMRVKNDPAVIDIEPNYDEKLFMEDCRFENISGPAIKVSLENNAGNFVSLRNIVCRKVPTLVTYKESGHQVKGNGNIYRVKNYLHGLQMDSLHADPVVKAIQEIEPLKAMPGLAKSDIPEFPAMDTWVNLKTLQQATAQRMIPRSSRMR